MGRFPSGQREQTVNLPLLASVVRIHPCPPYLREWRNWQTRMIQVQVYVRTCRFKSCFPHVEPLIFKGSKLFTTTVLLPYYYRIFGLLRFFFAGGFFGNMVDFFAFVDVIEFGIRKPSGFAEGFGKDCSLFLSHVHAFD